MGTKKEIEHELKKNSLLFYSLIGLGIITLITSTLLQTTDVFPSTPSLVFKIINGCSIAFILVIGVIWSQLEKKIESKFVPAEEA